MNRLETTMKVFPLAFAALLGAPLPLLAHTPEQPSSDVQKIDVSSSALRTDVRERCAGIEESLRQSLAWRPVGAEGVVRVEFRVDAGQVTEVNAYGSGLQRAYRQTIERAMHGIACHAANGQPQNYAFLLQVTPADGHPATSQLALLKP
jgi:hypothetical protein